MEMRAWQGDNPFYLHISLPDGAESVIVDLDEKGWATTYADWLRVTSMWSLLRKDHSFPAMHMVVLEGEQPYYTARHFATTSAPGEYIAYGIGKKRLDGATDRMWAFLVGLVCTGDDVDVIGRMLLAGRG
jgi:hypothetical protein